MTSSLLQRTRLGGFSTTPLGIGTSRLGAFWQGRSVRDGAAALSQALDSGVGLVDTADVYARGISERIVGRVTKTRPETLVMTKVGLLKTPAGLLAAARASGRRSGASGRRLDASCRPSGIQGLRGLRAAGRADTCFEPAYLRQAAARCLERQGRDELDVLLLHEPKAADLRREEVIAELNRMRSAGMIRAWGASVREAEAAAALMDAPGAEWLQLPVNLGDLRAAESIRNHPRRGEVSVVGLAVLGDGELMRRTAPLGLSAPRLVAALVEGAYEIDGVDAVLLGMSSPDHVRDNIAALARGARREDIRRISEVLREEP